MKAAFPGVTLWFWTILTIIVIAIAMMWALNQIDFSGVSGSVQSEELETDTVIFSLAYPQVSESQVVRYLQENAGEKLKDEGSAFYRLGTEYDTDPAFAIAVSRRETSMGKETCGGISSDCNNFFCIKDTTGSSDCGAWASYDTPEEGIEAFYMLIENYKKRDQDTITEIACAPGSGFSHSAQDYCYCEKDGSYCPSWATGPNSVSEYTAEIRNYLRA